MLITRSLFTNQPREALFSFIENHKARSQLNWQNIEELKTILYYISRNQVQYDQHLDHYNKLSQELKKSFILKVKKEGTWRIDLPVTASAFGTAFLSLTTGLNNIFTEANKTTYVIGIMQCIFSAPQLISGVSNIAHIYDLIIKLPTINSWFARNRNTSLLPSSYSNEEISIQSHFIALLGVTINKDVNFSSENLKRYSHQLGCV